MIGDEQLSPSIRLVLSLARVLLAVLRPAVPPPLRERWREEWLAEIDHAGTQFQHRRWGAARLSKFVWGTVSDAARLRRLPRAPAVRERTPAFESIGQDLRQAARGLAAAPTFTLTVVGSLALGLAANTAAFAFLESALFPGLPGASESRRLMSISLERRCHDHRCAMRSSFADLPILREAIPGLTGVTASARLTFPVRARNQAVSVGGALVSANYFDVLGVKVPLGRGFNAAEDAPANGTVAVIGATLWGRVFASDPSVLGEFISVAGHQVRIVGVASDEFGGPPRLGMPAAEIWLPFGMAPLLGVSAPQTGGTSVDVDLGYIGRLAAAASREEVALQAQAAAARIDEAHPEPRKGALLAAVRPVGAKDPSGLLIDVALILIVPLVVLVIACINAANLLLVRGHQRSRDIAVRLALGASRWRIVRELLIECLLLSLFSAALTIPLVYGAVRGVESLVPLPLRVDLSTIAFAVATAVASVLVFGLVPALRLSAARPGPSLAGRDNTGSSRSRVRRGLVVAQVALSLGLLATGSQLINAVALRAGMTAASDPKRLLLVSFDLTQFRLPSATIGEFYDAILERVRQIPGVERAGLAVAETFRGVPGSGLTMWLPGTGADDGRYILGGYAGGDLFSAIGLRLLQGRGFEPADRTAMPRVAVISRAAAQWHFGGEALGRVIRIAPAGRKSDAAHEVQIVGVIESARDPIYVRTPDAAIPFLYLPSRLGDEPALTLYVRAADSPFALLPAIRQAVDSVDPRVPFVSTETLADRRFKNQTEERLAAQGLTALGILALALAAGGLYGMVGYIVSIRRREVGVRMALGANPLGIVRLMLAYGLSLAAIGAAVGGGLALLVSAWLRSSMPGIPPLNAIAVLVPAALLGVTMLVASFIPARRAARVDPLIVLRQE